MCLSVTTIERSVRIFPTRGAPSLASALRLFVVIGIATTPIISREAGGELGAAAELRARWMPPPRLDGTASERPAEVRNDVFISGLAPLTTRK